MLKGVARVLALLSFTTGVVEAQGLPDSLIAQIRSGTARFRIAGDSASVRLVGSPTMPVIEASINGRGPYRFLLDLGSNVTIFRKDVVANASGRTLAKRERSDIVAFDSITVGAAVFSGIVGGAYDTLDVDGVLGFNILRNASFTIDYPGARFSMHRRQLPAPDGRTVIPFQLVGRMPFVWVKFGTDSLLANLDTGDSHSFTIPPSLRDSIRWSGEAVPGQAVWNNQTGRRTVPRSVTADSVAIGSLRLGPIIVHIDESADTPWMGSASMQTARWTFDPANLRVEIIPVAVKRHD